MAIRHIFAGKDIKSVLIGEPHLAINFKGEPFSAEDLFKILREYVVQEGWQGKNGMAKLDMNFPESMYIQRVNPQLGRDIWWRWRFHKNPIDNHKFWKWHLFIDVHCLWIKQVEVTIKDKKVKADSGEVEVQIRGWLEHDAERKWEKNPYLKPFKNIWIKRIQKWQYDTLYGQLRAEVYKLHDLVKNFLTIQTFQATHEMEGFFPKKLPE